MIPVEPLAGPELDRLITALLNATGVVHQVIQTTPHPEEAAGVEIIGRVAGRLRGALSQLAEHNTDEDLAFATQLLAETTLLIVSDCLRGF
jgi:hypothetical protein